MGDAVIDRALAEPYAAARAAKAAGRKVVGVVTNDAPFELIHAAGLFSLQLAPQPGPTLHADRYMESLFDPMLRSVFDQALSGKLDFLDAIVLPRSNDSAQRTYYYLCELQRTGVLTRSLKPLLFDVQKLPSRASAEYTYQRVLDLKAELEMLGGQSVNAEGLRSSIELYNQIRAAMRKLGEARAALKVSGVQAMEAMLAASLGSPESALEVLSKAAATQSAAQGEPTILIGSAHCDAALHAAIGKAGGQVVGDFHWRGDLYYGPEIEAGEPLRAIAEHHGRDVYAARTFPAPHAELTAFAKARGARAAIFLFYKEEEALVWDAPSQMQALRAAGVRVLSLTQQPWPAQVAQGDLTAFYGARAS